MKEEEEEEEEEEEISYGRGASLSGKQNPCQKMFRRLSDFGDPSKDLRMTTPIGETKSRISAVRRRSLEGRPGEKRVD